MNVFLAILMTEYTKAMNKQIAEAEAEIFLEAQLAADDDDGQDRDQDGNLVELELSEIPDAESDEGNPAGSSTSSAHHATSAAMLSHMTSSIMKSPNASKYMVAENAFGKSPRRSPNRSPRRSPGAGSTTSPRSPARSPRRSPTMGKSPTAFPANNPSLAFTKSVRFAQNGKRAEFVDPRKKS